MRGLGLKVGKSTDRTFARRINELVAGHSALEVVAQALLAAQAVLLREFNGLDKRVDRMARSYAPAKLLMTTTAVGPVV